MTTVTDWISCTTPPVRDGFYDVHAVADFASSLLPIASEFKNGKFFGILEDGQRYVMGAVNKSPERWLWRGRRMWVIERPDAFTDRPMYLEVLSHQCNVWSSEISDAMAFETEAEAKNVIESRWPGSTTAKAVQP